MKLSPVERASQPVHLSEIPANQKGTNHPCPMFSLSGFAVTFETLARRKANPKPSLSHIKRQYKTHLLPNPSP